MVHPVAAVVGFALTQACQLTGAIRLRDAPCICAMVMLSYGVVRDTGHGTHARCWPGGLGEQEVISSIRTVAAFSGERKETARYDDKVEKAAATAIKSGML